MATNATIDAAAALFPAPYGPLTRITDLDALDLDPNDDVNLLFETDDTVLGAVYEVYLSANELSDTDWAEQLIGQQIGTPAQVLSLVDRIVALEAVVSALVPPYTVENYRDIIQDMRVDFPELKAY